MNKKKMGIMALSIFVMIGMGAVTARAENIDPDNDDSQYAYGENVGYLNFEPGGNGGSGAEVTNSAVTGYVWGENIGWINLSPVSGGVVNDGAGNLSGYAWGENVGWINFKPTGGGVTIGTDGVFDGWAWGENIGWIHLKNAAIPYKVKTAWTPLSITPTPTPTLTATPTPTPTPVVTFTFDGFYAPVDNPPVMNIAKAGQTIPLKWHVTDQNGDPVTNITSVEVKVTTLLCNTETTPDQLEEYAAGDSGLQNLGDGYYQFNWKTPRSYAKSCKTLKLDLGDGVIHEALFHFKR